MSIKKIKGTTYKMFETQLQIARNLKKVMYDNYVYKVKKVIHLPKSYENAYSQPYTHKCTDTMSFTVEFNDIIELDNKMIHVAFCNRCKKLFLKEVA